LRLESLAENILVCNGSVNLQCSKCGPNDLDYLKLDRPKCPVDRRRAIAARSH
jgi:hypothetical protein